MKTRNQKKDQMPFLPEPLVDFCGEDSEAKFEAKNKKRQACD